MSTARISRPPALGAEAPPTRVAHRYSINDTRVAIDKHQPSVELRDKETDEIIIGWYEDEVGEAIEDGILVNRGGGMFIDERSLHKSAFEYAEQMGLLPNGGKHRKRRKAHGSAPTDWRETDADPLLVAIERAKEKLEVAEQYCRNLILAAREDDQKTAERAYDSAVGALRDCGNTLLRSVR